MSRDPRLTKRQMLPEGTRPPKRRAQDKSSGEARGPNTAVPQDLEGLLNTLGKVRRRDCSSSSTESETECDLDIAVQKYDAGHHIKDFTGAGGSEIVAGDETGAEVEPGQDLGEQKLVTAAERKIITLDRGNDDYAHQLAVDHVSEKRIMPHNTVTGAEFERIESDTGEENVLTITYEVPISSGGFVEKQLRFDDHDKFRFKSVKSVSSPFLIILGLGMNKLETLRSLWFNFSTRLINAVNNREPFYSIVRTDAPHIAAIVDYFNTRIPASYNGVVDEESDSVSPYIGCNLKVSRWYTNGDNLINPEDFVGQLVECLGKIDFTCFTKKVSTGRYGVKPFLVNGRMRLGGEKIPDFYD